MMFSTTLYLPGVRDSQWYAQHSTSRTTAIHTNLDRHDNSSNKSRKRSEEAFQISTRQPNSQGSNKSRDNHLDGELLQHRGHSGKKRKSSHNFDTPTTAWSFQGGGEQLGEDVGVKVEPRNISPTEDDNCPSETSTVEDPAQSHVAFCTDANCPRERKRMRRNSTEESKLSIPGTSSQTLSNPSLTIIQTSIDQSTISQIKDTQPITQSSSFNAQNSTLPVCPSQSNNSDNINLSRISIASRKPTVKSTLSLIEQRLRTQNFDDLWISPGPSAYLKIKRIRDHQLRDDKLYYNVELKECEIRDEKSVVSGAVYRLYEVSDVLEVRRDRNGNMLSATLSWKNIWLIQNEMCPKAICEYMDNLKLRTHDGT